MSNFPLNADRLWQDIMDLAAITDPGQPWTRRSFTPLFLQGRELVRQRFVEAGLTVRRDAAGNLIGRLEGRNPALGVIAIGSHSDSVPSGGRFDGMAGLATAIEVVRALREAGQHLDHTIEVIDFLAEEPSEYGVSCVGSRGMTGVLEDRMLALTEPGGETLRDAMRRIGADPDRLKEAVRKDIVAFAELHIEQGIVLESQGLDIGIVTSFVGIRRLEISYDGEVDHAGTTPLHLRKDALVAGAETVVAVRQLAEALNAEGKGYFVATVGILNTTPMASNIVPGTCRLIVDVRSTAPELTTRFVEQIDAASAKAAETMRVRRSVFRTLSDNPPTTCDAEVQQALRDGARELGLGQIDLPSGAGHDAAYMSRICRSAMVFVPCRGGKSHAPEEWSDREQIAAGAATMLLAIKRLDQSLQTA